MNDEEKKYSIIGQVTIGTDEYRDLIEAVAEARKDAEENNSKWYEEYQKANTLNKQLEEARKQAESLSGFVNSSEEIKAKYRLYLVERQMAAQKEEQE